MLYHFDLLPYHPQPEPLQSFTQYLMDLAIGNGIQGMHSLSVFLFPSQDRTVILGQSDYPPMRYKTLMKLTGLSKNQIMDMTFVPLAQKLGYSLNPKYMGHTLKREIGESLRVCPVCIDKYGYYFLHWRFLLLKGCVEHRCEFLDLCPNCEQAMPFLSYPFRTGYCPHCDFDLTTAATPRISDDEISDLRKRTKDLKFLLTRQGWEEKIEQLNPYVGKYVALERTNQQLLVKDIADAIKAHNFDCWRIERGQDYAVQEAVKLSTYLKYFHYLNLSIADIYRQALDNMEDDEFLDQNIISEYNLRNEIYYDQCVEIAAELESQGIIPTPETVSDEMGMTIPGLSYYEDIHEFFNELRASARQSRNYRFLKELKEALNRLVSQGKKPTQAALGKELGLSGCALRIRGARDSTGRVRRVLDQAKEAVSRFRRLEYLQRQCEVFYKVINAMRSLQAENIDINCRRVANYLNTSHAALHYYDLVAELFNTINYNNKNGIPIDIDELLDKFDPHELLLRFATRSSTADPDR